MDIEIVTAIKEGYFRVRTFFLSHVCSKTVDFADEEEKFLEQEARTFYERFSHHPWIIRGERVERYISKFHFVPLRFRDGLFEYPRTFARYLDRTKDLHYLSPKAIWGLDDLDDFVDKIPKQIGLDTFLTGFFDYIKRVELDLRRREMAVLRVMSNMDFLRVRRDLMPRTVLPTAEELLDGLHWPQTKLNSVKRARKLLLDFRVCDLRAIILNAGKIGFYYAALLLEPESISEGLKPYVLWQIPYRDRLMLVLCMPFGEVETLVGGEDYVPLNNLLWSVDLSQYDGVSGRRWQDFRYRLFADAVTNYRNCDLNQPVKHDLNSNEIDILRRLSSNPVLSFESRDQLSNTMNSRSIHKFLGRMVLDDVYQYYPYLNHLGLDYRICFLLEVENDLKLFNQVINGLLSYPIIDIYLNWEQEFAVGSVNIPRPVIHKWITDLRDFYTPEIGIRFSPQNLMIPSKISRCPPLFQMPAFAMEHGSASVI